MRKLLLNSVCLVFGMLLASLATASSGLVVDLSNDEVEITTDFNGSSVLMFGAIDVAGDVVVVVKGPLGPKTVRKKERIGGVWLNTDEIIFGNVPAFYAVAANRPLHKVAPVEIRDGEEIGLEFLRFDPALESAAEPTAKLAEFHRALIRNKREAGLYRASLYPLQILSDKLFRTEIWFPASVATGAYRVVVYVLEGGRVIDSQSVTLTARKVGVGAEIYRFAHQQSAIYGVVAIIIAVAAGWLAAAVFRKT